MTKLELDCIEYLSNKELIERLTKRNKEIKENITNKYLKEKLEITKGKYSIKLVKSTRNSFDKDKFKKEHLKLYNKYTKTKEVEMFYIKVI